MSPGIEIRGISPEEVPEFVRADGAAFGQVSTDEDIEWARTGLEIDRSLAAVDRGRIVGTAGAFSFQLTLPGLTVMPVAGVTWVSVLPTHRRRGILRSMMARQLHDIRERGEAVAILLASESLIYGRFGYGMATTQTGLEIDTHHGAFARAPEVHGETMLVDKEKARIILPDVFDRARLLQPGQINRRPSWWDGWFKDREAWRGGASARFYVVYESNSGQVDGYVSYRMKSDWSSGKPTYELQVADLFAVTREAHAGLWKYCLNVDLVVKLVIGRRPLDEPVRWMLADPRRLRFTDPGDFLWARLVDIPAALAARRYTTEGCLVFAVTDPFCPDNDGRYELTGGPDGAQSRRSDKEPDLSLQVDDLGAVYLGGVRPSTLAKAGRVEERTPGALARADTMFASSSAPWCATGF